MVSKITLPDMLEHRSKWERYDNLGMMQQLGVVGEPGQGGS